ncbi:AMP-binding protein [Pasteurella sp. PK-2025]|uniref:AMP-binding protein n=1 Tax=Pasteurella sp. PK-2025 TaxID=3413133 RepID=UPI003C731A5E
MLNENTNTNLNTCLTTQFITDSNQLVPIKQMLYQTRQADEIICLGNNRQYHWQDLQMQTAYLIEQLNHYPNDREVALVFKSGFLMLCGLLAALHCQRKIVLPALQTAAHLTDIDEHFSLLCTDDEKLSAAVNKSVCLFQHQHKTAFTPFEMPLSAVQNEAEIYLFTSGSTGKPKVIEKSVHLFDRQIKVEHQLLKDVLQGSVMYSTVNHNHLLGLMYRLLQPFVFHMPFFEYSLVIPEQLQKINTDYTLISSPAFLRFLDPHLTYPKARVLFSSGGKLPRQSGENAQRLLQCDVMEFYGSSETSAIAYRTFPHQQWQLLEGIQVRQNQEDECLMIASPFLHTAEWYKLEDKVRLNSTGFELLGRIDRIAKIGDKRVSLTQIECFCLELNEIEEIKSIVVKDPHRESIGLVVVLHHAYQHLSPKDTLNLLRQHLHQRVELIALPRKIRLVPFMPMNEQGKMNLQQLESLFA